MASYLALLRAVNVGGTKRIAMDELRSFFESLEFAPVQTLLQSGNVVFTSSSRSTKKLESLLEARAETDLGLQTDFFVRSAREWRDVVRNNPFPREAKKTPSKLVVVSLKSAPPERAVASLQSSVKGPELIRARGKHAYIVYSNGIGRSPLTGARIEKGLGQSGTARNWNTVLKLESAAYD